MGYLQGRSSSRSCETLRFKRSEGKYEVFFVLNIANPAEELNKKENRKIFDELKKHYKVDARIITGIAYAYNHGEIKNSETDIKVTTSIDQGITQKLYLSSNSHIK